MGGGGVTVGRGCTLSPYSKIISSGYDLEQWVKEGIRVHRNRDVVIGNRVWVGSGAMIMPGVHITGEYVCIAPGAVVTHDIEESRVLLGGIPASVIRKL